jgi:hypothetical protein
MKKTNLLLILLMPMALHAQFIVGDSKDRSSILNQPAAVGIDVTDAKVNFEFNNIHGQTAYKNKLLVGVRYSGGNTQGSSQLFKGGQFVFGSELKGFIAFSWLENDAIVRAYNKQIYDVDKSNHDKRAELLVTLNQYLTADIAAKFADKEKQKLAFFVIFNKPGKTSAEDVTFLQTRPLKSDQSDLEDTSYRVFLKAMNFTEAEMNIVRDFFIKAHSYVDATYGQFASDNAAKRASLGELRDSYLRIKGGRRNTFFIRGGINGKQFDLLDTLEDTSVAFAERTFRGGFFEVGFNRFINGRCYLGISFLRDWIDNLGALSEQEFSIAKADSIGDDQYEYKQTKKAFIGDYVKSVQNTIYLDGAYLFPFQDQSTLALSPYFRINMPGGKSAVNSTDFGTSVNWYKNNHKFMFGVFVEFEDLADDYETGKSFLTRPGFGFRTNYSFNTLVGLSR